MAIEAARVNKHIVCEKPIAVSYSQAVEMALEVEKSGVGFAVPFAYRFYPIVRELRSRIQEGQAGPLHLIHGNYLQDWLADPEATNWRVDSVSGGRSRAFADIGTHWCDLMEFVSGDRITRLIANTSKAYESRGDREVGTEDIATIMFETQRGAVGTLTVSQVSVGRKNQLLIELSGPGASFTFNQEKPDSMLIGGMTSTQIVTSGQGMPGVCLRFLQATHRGTKTHSTLLSQTHTLVFWGMFALESRDLQTASGQQHWSTRFLNLLKAGLGWM